MKKAQVASPSTHKKVLSQAQLQQKLHASVVVKKECSATGFLTFLKEIEQRYLQPLQKQIDTYKKSRKCAHVQKLFAEKDKISGWEWHPKKSGVKVYWSNDEDRERELKNEIRRESRFEFRDGVKVHTMFHLLHSGAGKMKVYKEDEEHVLVTITDARFGTPVVRYSAMVQLNAEFLADFPDAEYGNRLWTDKQLLHFFYSKDVSFLYDLKVKLHALMSVLEKEAA